MDWTIWFNEFSFSIEESVSCPRVTHFFYELGFLLENQNEVGKQTILAIDIEYQNFARTDLIHPDLKIDLNLYDTIDFETYQKLFYKGRDELLAGNCYQFNLTCEHRYKWDPVYTPENFIASLWSDKNKRGAFGSATYIPQMNVLYLSNSPECLFQMDENILSTMPIKGTLLLENEEDKKLIWANLVGDKKNESELFMIIDLLRNDLSRIEYPKARVVNKKLPANSSRTYSSVWQK